MSLLFNDYSSLVDNTNEISKKCNVSLSTKGYFLPEYPVPKEHDFDSFIKKLSSDRLDTLISDLAKDKQDEYESRLNYELDQIKKMGFSSYFLIVYDFIEWSKNNDVPVGPGRGSGAGSLVAYALGITTLDPIKHGLLFERFLNPERLSMPDFATPSITIEPITGININNDKIIEFIYLLHIPYICWNKSAISTIPKTPAIK